MSQIKNKTFDKIDYSKLRMKPFLCKDMSVKFADKEYIECDEECMKDNPRFGFLQIYLNKDPKLLITTPVMKCLFGVQKNGSNFNMSLQFTNIKEDETMKYFYDFIQEMEFLCMKQLGLTKDDASNFISQIKHDKNNKYDPNLNVKLPFHKNKFQTDIYSENSSGFNLFNIQRFTAMKCDIYLDKIWKMNDKFYAKWKCSYIHII